MGEGGADTPKPAPSTDKRASTLHGRWPTGNRPDSSLASAQMEAGVRQSIIADRSNPSNPEDYLADKTPGIDVTHGPSPLDSRYAQFLGGDSEPLEGESLGQYVARRAEKFGIAEGDLPKLRESALQTYPDRFGSEPTPPQSK